MTREAYQMYLASREWALKREAVRKRANNQCERCWMHPMDAVHHKTYARVGNENLDDLMAICDECHKFISGKSSVDPKIVTDRRLTHFDADVILCPYCNGNYLHQASIETFSRKEDQEIISHHIDCQTGTLSESRSRNPSSRRDGLLVRFTCETCNAGCDGPTDSTNEALLPWGLAVYQHKGQTSVEWIPAP